MYFLCNYRARSVWSGVSLFAYICEDKILKDYEQNKSFREYKCCAGIFNKIFVGPLRLTSDTNFKGVLWLLLFLIVSVVNCNCSFNKMYVSSTTWKKLL